jgi:hypothetical protein
MLLPNTLHNIALLMKTNRKKFTWSEERLAWQKLPLVSSTTSSLFAVATPVCR